MRNPIDQLNGGGGCIHLKRQMLFHTVFDALLQGLHPMETPNLRTLQEKQQTMQERGAKFNQESH